MQVTTRVLEDGAGVLVTAEGELDVNTADSLRQAMVEAEAHAPSIITVELSGVTFMDSTGLGVLIGALNRAEERKGVIRLAAPTPRVTRLLALTGMDQRFQIVDSAT